MGLGEKVLEIVRVRSFAVSLTGGYHFAHKIEPSAIKATSGLNRCVLEGLPLFVWINSELLQQGPE
jgi:hypothetical protein